MDVSTAKKPLFVISWVIISSLVLLSGVIFIDQVKIVSNTIDLQCRK